MKARTWIATLSGAALAVSTAVVIGGATTSANAGTGTGGPPTVTPGGSLTLVTSNTATNATITYANGSATPPVQTISTAKDKCSLATSGASLVKFSSKAAGGVFNAPSYYKKGIGVSSGNNTTGTACGQVNTYLGESLTLSLDNSATGSLAGATTYAVVNNAAFDMNLSGNAVIQADLYRGGALGTRVGGAQLQSGFSAPQALQGTYASTDQRFVCNFASNSGPQSGYNNNCYWKIPTLTYAVGTVSNPDNPYQLNGGATVANTTPGGYDYDTIVLTPLLGDFAIQGGAAYASAPAGVGGPTVLNLDNTTDGTLDCNQQTDVVSQDGNVTSVQVARLYNGLTSQATCRLIPYTLSASGGQATFHKPEYTDQSSAQFVVTFTRTIPVDAGGTTVTLPVTGLKINWEDSAVTTSGSATVDLLTTCPATLYKPGPVFTYTGIPASADMSPLTGLQYACEFSQQQLELADGSLQVTDVVYLTGDAKFAY